MMPVKEAAEHLRELMDSMYKGRSVRTGDEFRDDLAALRVACNALDEKAAEEARKREKGEQ